MKKRIGFIVLLIAVTTGMAFAKDGRDIEFTTYGDPTAGDVWINSVKEALQGVNISYGCKPANKLVEVDFDFTAYYEDGSSKSWTNHETWLSARRNSTWRFALLSASKVTSITISWTRTNPPAFAPLKL